jgi:hypothetical protein
MKAIRAVLGDRRRRQRGSVLSAVLIMVAFLGIISGALVTALSTQFLISRVLVNRVGNEATVNSAMELALDQLQNSALKNGCPGAGALSSPPFPAPVTLNGRTAAVLYTGCFPTVDMGSPQYTSIASAASFDVDGFQGVVNGQNLYLIGDSSSTIYQYQFGQSTPSWSLPLQTNITGPPLVMPDTGASPPDPTDISNLVPVAGGGGPGGCQANSCVELVQQDTNRPAPDFFCFMGANRPVTSRPAAGIAFPGVAYFGDTGGTLWAYSATEAGNCALQARATTTGNAPITAGPIVFRNGIQDEIYVVTSTGQLHRFSYDPSDRPALTLTDTLSLPFINPVGIALHQTNLAITFGGGGVALVNIPSNFDPALRASTLVGPGFDAAPAWCSCPSGTQIGAVGRSGTFYLYDGNLSFIGSYAVGSPVRTSPAADGVGEWFFGADDGFLHELQEPPAGTSVTQVARFDSSSIGQVQSSVQVGPCSAGICVYMGSVNNAYIVSLDARDATLTACLSQGLGVCSTANPRLLSQVEVGDSGNPQTVHVQAWSYYSP